MSYLQMYYPLILEVVITVLAFMLVFTTDWLPRGLKFVIAVVLFVYISVHMPHYLQIAAKVAHGEPLYSSGYRSTLVDVILR